MNGEFYEATKGLGLIESRGTAAEIQARLLGPPREDMIISESFLNELLMYEEAEGNAMQFAKNLRLLLQTR